MEKLNFSSDMAYEFLPTTDEQILQIDAVINDID